MYTIFEGMHCVCFTSARPGFSLALEQRYLHIFLVLKQLWTRLDQARTRL